MKSSLTEQTYNRQYSMSIPERIQGKRKKIRGKYSTPDEAIYIDKIYHFFDE
jgi:hypothetical protein